MRISFRSLSVLLLTLTLAATSCKKEDQQPATDTTSTTQLKAHSDDQSRVSSEMDAVTSDINLAMESSTTFSGKGAEVNTICGGTAVLDTTSNPRTITITYNGLNCTGTHTRTGTVVVSMAQGVQWKHANAVITVSYQHLKITRVSDNKWITINGTHTYTNVTGGLLWQLPTMQVIKHRLHSNNMSITFMDSTSRNWSVARQREFSISNNSVLLTITGLNSTAAQNGIAEWGTNRFGHPFATAITQPIKIRQDCNFRITSGEVKHTGMALTGTVTFGLDSNGNPTTCPGNNPFYYKVVWTGPNGNTQTHIAPY